MKILSLIKVLLFWGLSGLAWSCIASDQGKEIEFVIEKDGASYPQTALVDNHRLSVKRAGGNPNLDILFDANIRTLFIIDHNNKSYYRIDQPLIDKVASMIDSISTIAKSQQGVLADLLGSLGLGGDEAERQVVTQKTEQMLLVSGIKCALFQTWQDQKLHAEMCMAHESNLSGLGIHYHTLETFYGFGDQLLNRAGEILSNMGFLIPSIHQKISGGLPILIDSIEEGIRTRLVNIKSSSIPPKTFLMPDGYVQTPIPFIS